MQHVESGTAASCRRTRTRGRRRRRSGGPGSRRWCRSGRPARCCSGTPRGPAALDVGGVTRPCVPVSGSNRPAPRLGDRLERRLPGRGEDAGCGRANNTGQHHRQPRALRPSTDAVAHVPVTPSSRPVAGVAQRHRHDRQRRVVRASVTNRLPSVTKRLSKPCTRPNASADTRARIRAHAHAAEQVVARHRVAGGHREVRRSRLAARGGDVARRPPSGARSAEACRTAGRVSRAVG